MPSVDFPWADVTIGVAALLVLFFFVAGALFLAYKFLPSLITVLNDVAKVLNRLAIGMENSDRFLRDSWAKHFEQQDRIEDNVTRIHSRLDHRGPPR